MIYTKSQAEAIACPVVNSPSCRTDKCSAWRWTGQERLIPIRRGNLSDALKPAPTPVEIGFPGLSIKAPVQPTSAPIFEGTGEFYGYCGLAGKPEYGAPGNLVL